MNQKPHIIVAALGSKGDFFPFLAVAKEMQQRGYKCTILSHEPYMKYAEGEGVSFKAIMNQRDSDRLLRNPDLWKATKGLEVIFKHAILATSEAFFTEIDSIASQGPSFLVTTCGLIGAHMVKRKHNLACVSLQLAPFTHFSYVDPPKDVPFINALYRLIGVRGRKRLVKGYYKKFNRILSEATPTLQKNNIEAFEDFVGKNRYECDRLLDFWPDWFCHPKPDWPEHACRVGFLNYEGPTQPSKGPSWIEAFGLADILAKNPIVFAMGSEMRQKIELQTKTFENSCRLLGSPGIMVTPTVSGKKVISSNLIQIEYAPFMELFSHASLVVTHGGIGTITRVMTLGKPSIVLPMAFDQYDNAYQLKRLGISDHIGFSRLSAQRLVRKIRALMGQESLEASLNKVKMLSSDNNGDKNACDKIEAIIGAQGA